MTESLDHVEESSRAGRAGGDQEFIREEMSIKAGFVWSLAADGKQGALGSKCSRGGNWLGESALVGLESAAVHETAAVSAQLMGLLLSSALRTAILPKGRKEVAA